jgi:hypothetical protein
MRVFPVRAHQTRITRANGSEVGRGGGQRITRALRLLKKINPEIIMGPVLYAD